MSLRERVLIVLGVIGAIGLVVYPLAYRIMSEAADGAEVVRIASPAPLPGAPAPTAAHTVAPAMTARPPTESPAPQSDQSWRADATAHRGAIGKSFAYVCTRGGTLGPIWGTDTFTDDSSVCTAGVHQGVITREGGGSVTIVIRRALESYVASTRNGVTTEAWERWDGSYEVIKP